jgi:hypothetical protein
MCSQSVDRERQLVSDATMNCVPARHPHGTARTGAPLTRRHATLRAQIVTTAQQSVARLSGWQPGYFSPGCHLGSTRAFPDIHSGWADCGVNRASLEPRCADASPWPLA